MGKRIDTVTITIDAAAARKEVDALRKRSEELGKSLAEMKKQLEDPGLSKTSAEWKQLNREYKEAKKEQKELNHLVEQGEQSIKGMNDVLANLSKATYNDLIKQQRILQRTIKNTSPDTKKYAELQAALRAVNGQVDKLKAGWKAHDSQIVQTAKRLASYVITYSGFNFIVGKLKEMVGGTLELSDAMADVQKTTGIAGDELKKLSREIDSLDTRTTQQELHELAATAGQIGLESREDVLGFVKASNELTVALNELGDDGVLSLTKIAQLTGDIERLGVEGALKAIGSSINELEASSSAAAGPIADFISRVGSVAPIANLATSDLAAMGATADALGQQMEVSGTSMSKFITSIVNNTESIAFALNMEEDTLKDLIDTGQTMEAIIQVLKKVKQESDISGGALTEVFKEFGSEGERMVRVIQAMANNTDLLREQVTLSAEAFANATSVTEEYNVKNENAAAIAQRISNAWKEFFVSADNTTTLTGILNKLLDLTKFLTGVSNGVTVFRSALTAAMVAITSTKLGITGFLNSLGQLVTGIKLTDSTFLGHITTLHKAERGTMAYKRAVVSLNASMKAFMAANWFTLLASAVAAVVAVWGKWNMEVRMLNEAKAEMIQTQEKEKKQLKELYSAATDVKSTDEERAAAIRKINEQYGDLLGYHIEEKASINELTTAYNLLNAEMDKRLANMIKEKMLEGPSAEYAKESKDNIASLITALKIMETETKKASETITTDVVSALMSAAEESDNFYSSWSKFKEEMSEMGYEDSAIEKIWNLQNSRLKEQFELQVELVNARNAAQAAADAIAKDADKKAAEARAANINAMYKEIRNVSKEAISNMTKDELEALINKGNVVEEYEEKMFEERAARIKKENPELQGDALTQRLKKELKDLESVRTAIEPIRKAYAGDAWGKAFNIDGWKTLVDELDKTGTASVKSLVDTYKEMEEATQKYSDVNELNRVFKTNYTNIADMQLYIRSLAQKLEQALNAQGRDTSGGFLKDRADAMRREREQEMKEEFEAAKSALEAYYREQQRIINELHLGQAITKEEHTRRISQSNQEMKRSFVDLYSVILGEAKEYGTDFDKILPGKDLQLLAKNLTDFGPAMVDGIKNARANSELEIQNEAIKIREIIEKALLEGDMFGKLETEFRTMLDELSLLTSKFGSEFIAVDESTAKALVSQLTGMADEAYTMTEQELLAEAKKRSKGNETLTAWWSGVDEDQLTLILEKLKGYYDDRLEMQRRYAQRMQREWQQYYKQTGGEAAYEAEKALVEQAKSRQDKIGGTSRSDYHQRLGLVSAEVDNEVKKIDSNMEFLGKAIENRKNEIVGDLMTILKAEEALLSTMTEGTEEYAAQENKIAGIKANISRVIAGDSELQTLYGQQLDLQADRNAKMAEGESLLTDIMVSEWERRAEKMSTWTEMMGDYLGDWLSLEYQANQARLRGDEETAKELEAQQEESKQNLIKSALNELVELGKVWATEYAMKLMYNSANLAADTTTAAASTGVAVTEASSKLIAGGYAAAGKEIGSKGWVGLATGAAIIAAAVGLAAALKAAIANMFPEAVEGVKDAEASAPKRKLTTGMLTYADGKYPVLGNDGVVYDAEYAGANMKTGVYRGPHFGIFAEKQPEMVIDGNTTQRLVLNYPEVYNGILQLSRTGSMRTYADGNVSEFAAATSAQQQAQMEEMRLTMAATAAAVAALNAQLAKGIGATVNRYGRGGTLEAERKGQRWEARNRV